MANLQVRDINEELYSTLRFSAELDGRSISQQVINILQLYFTNNQKQTSNATLEFLELCGQWDDSRNAEEICQVIRDSRVNRIR